MNNDILAILDASNRWLHLAAYIKRKNPGMSWKDIYQNVKKILEKEDQNE